MTDDRDATSILVWNGHVSRTRPAHSQELRSRPVDGLDHEHDVDDHAESGGSVIEGIDRQGAETRIEPPAARITVIG